MQDYLLGNRTVVIMVFNLNAAYKISISFNFYKMFYHEEYNEHITKETVNNDQNCLLKSSDFISKPIKSVRCTIDENILQLQYPLSDKNINLHIYVLMFNCGYSLYSILNS